MGKTMLSRRSFLGTAGAAVGGVVSSRSIPRNMEMKQPDKEIRNFNPDMRYRKLGNTDIHLSVLGLGGLGLENAVGYYAIAHGVNLVHISETYNNGNSVLELAKVMKTKRDKVYIAVKDTFKDIDAHLKTLNTDYIDFLMLAIHKAVNVPLEQNLETFEKYKKQGKVRYLGLTTHNEVKACLDAGIKTGWFSGLMPALNPPGTAAADTELKRAMEKGMGVFAMKTMKGIDDASLEPAVLKKILIQPAVTTVIRGFKSFEMFDNYLKAVQESLSFQEDMQLYRYAQKKRP